MWQPNFPKCAAFIIPILLCCSGPVRAADLVLTEAQAKEAAVARPLPEYPPMARQLSITGKVELQVLIGLEGKVEEVKILTGNPVLTKPCAKVVAEWKFRPFQQEGKPVKASAPLSFEFR